MFLLNQVTSLQDKTQHSIQHTIVLDTFSKINPDVNLLMYGYLIKELFGGDNVFSFGSVVSAVVRLLLLG